MSQEIRLNPITFASVRATERTEWTFAEVSDSRGATALVELTCGEATARASTLFAELSETLRSRVVEDESAVADALGLDAARLQRDRPLATAVSALRTALVSLRALHDGLSLAEALGGAAQGSVPLYANINRSMPGASRTPADFGLAAERAVRAGFTIVKCAPFDEVSTPASSEKILELARPGIERVAAVRAAVGPDVGVLVDCHSRFEAHTAPLVAERLAEFGIGWFEEPLEPTEQPDALARVAEKVEMPVGRRGERLRRTPLPRPGKKRRRKRHHAGHQVLRRSGGGVPRGTGGPGSRRTGLAAQPVRARLAARQRAHHAGNRRRTAPGARGERGHMALGTASTARAHRGRTPSSAGRRRPGRDSRLRRGETLRKDVDSLGANPWPSIKGTPVGAGLVPALFSISGRPQGNAPAY